MHGAPWGIRSKITDYLLLLEVSLLLAGVGDFDFWSLLRLWSFLF
jgi:hypothetical protein